MALESTRRSTAPPAQGSNGRVDLDPVQVLEPVDRGHLVATGQIPQMRATMSMTSSPVRPTTRRSK